MSQTRTELVCICTGQIDDLCNPAQHDPACPVAQYTKPQDDVLVVTRPRAAA